MCITGSIDTFYQHLSEFGTLSETRVRGHKAACREEKRFSYLVHSMVTIVQSIISHFTAAKSDKDYTFSPQRNKDVR